MAEKGTCSNCNLNFLDKVLKCGVCKSVAYCSPECQKEDWRFHKRNCKKPVPKGDSIEERAERETKKDPKMEELEKEMEADPKLKKQVEEMMKNMTGAKDEKEAEPQAPPSCQNCAQPCSKVMRCGNCKVATYCSAKCQKDDWQFHKRGCKKPEPDKGKGKGKDAPEAEASTAAADKPAPPRPKEGSTVERVDNEDVGTWYKHRDWKPTDEKKDFIPEKIAEAAAAGAASAAQTSATGSSWNKAGTWEEKSMLPWWKTRLAERLGGMCVESFAGNITAATPTEPVGDANVMHIRGIPRFFFDFHFEIPFNIKMKRSSIQYPGVVKVKEFSDASAAKEADFEVEVTASSEPDKKAVIQSFVPQLQTVLRELVKEYQEQVKGPSAAAAKFPGQLPPPSAS